MEKILYGDIKYFWKDVYVLYNIYIYMLKMFYVYIIFIDCILFFDISCGYYLIFKK